MKLLKKFHLCMREDYGFLKVIFTFFSAYLIFEELYIYVVLKPTYTTISKREMKPEDFPDIMLCPEPAIDIEAATAKGYEGIDEYYMGFNVELGFDQIGWAGYKSENLTKVSEEISVLKSEMDCPIGEKTQFTFQIKNQNISESISLIDFKDLKLIKALYPNHVCCKVKPPKLSKSSTLIGLHLFTSVKNKSFHAFEVFMADQLTSSYFDLHKTIMIGDEIISAKGANIYKVKILEDVKLDDDPQYSCIDYKVKGEYQKCITDEILMQNLNIMNCTPPWLTEREDLWCKGKIKYDSEEHLIDFGGFLAGLTISEYDPGKCSVPCKTKKYQTKHIGSKQLKEQTGIIIWFEHIVEITESRYTTGFKTLISKIGGFIGISKNFVWLIILLLSSIGVLRSHFKLHNIKKYINRR